MDSWVSYWILKCIKPAKWKEWKAGMSNQSRDNRSLIGSWPDVIVIYFDLAPPKHLSILFWKHFLLLFVLCYSSWARVWIARKFLYSFFHFEFTRIWRFMIVFRSQAKANHLSNRLSQSLPNIVIGLNLDSTFPL